MDWWVRAMYQHPLTYSYSILSHRFLIRLAPHPGVYNSHCLSIRTYLNGYVNKQIFLRMYISRYDRATSPSWLFCQIFHTVSPRQKHEDRKDRGRGHQTIIRPHPVLLFSFFSPTFFFSKANNLGISFSSSTSLLKFFLFFDLASFLIWLWRFLRRQFRISLSLFVHFPSLLRLGGGCRIHWLHLCRGVRLPKRVSWIWH